MKNTDNRLTFISIWRSKLALRLIPVFVSVVAVPLAVTVLVVGHIGQQQIIATARAMERSNEETVADAGVRFENLGQDALRQSSLKIANICISASRATSQQSERDQASSLAATGRDFEGVTQGSLDGAMHQSLSANNQVLDSIGSQMGSLFASSALYTQDRVGDRVQSALLVQINAQMAERAAQLAHSFDSYIATNMNYLGLTSQVLNLYENNPTAEQSVLDALVRRFPMMTEVSVLDSSGQETVISASNRVALPSDMGNRSFEPYFQSAINDQTFVGIDSFPVDGSAPILRLAVPIELYRGKAVGVLSATLSLDDLWDTIRNTRFGRSGYAYVSDSAGLPFLTPRHFAGSVLEQGADIKSMGWRLVVAQPADEVMEPIQIFKNDISRNTQYSLNQMHGDIKLASSLAAAKLLNNVSSLHRAAAAMLQSRTSLILKDLNKKTSGQANVEESHLQNAIKSQIVVGEKTTNGELVAAAKATSQSMELQIPGMTKRALGTANQRLFDYAFVIFSVSCALSCLIGFLLAGTLVRPIVQLSQGTRHLAAGDLEKRVDERGPAEIGDLAIAFNTMAASLQKSRADLTDAESQLVQSAKLASLGTLSAGVAHELNQPVAIVRGLAQQMKAEATVTLEMKDDLEIIEGQTSRMMKIITHLRTFCRTGGYELTPVDVNQVVRDCFILIDAQLKSHGVAVEFDLCEDPPVVLGDANELEQVFINLITNARDAMEGRSDALLHIATTLDNQNVTLEFRDNGTGIPDSASEHIFDPFFTTKEVGKGTGLGLSISHGLVQKHHGSIAVHNDRGAVFTITIPRLDADPSKKSGESTITRLAA